MKQFHHISVADAQHKLTNEGAVLADIRDVASFEQSHVSGSFHLTDTTLSQLMAEVEFETPLIVICYHGISSQGVAQYLIGQGFEEVYSLQGGFEAWQREASI